MTAYVGSNKIKDVSVHGVYVGSQNTNVITSVPKNINLTLSNGTLTLKAGSKVYVPNGFEADGTTPKYQIHVFDTDTVLNTYVNANRAMCLNTDNNTIFGQNISTEFYSGSNAPSGYKHMVWYDTTNNLIKYTANSGSSWFTNISFPFAIVSGDNSTGKWYSIDQIFDWCGFIGSTAFVLPGVKGLIPNGFKADGTYNVIEYTTDRVSSYEQAGTYSNFDVLLTIENILTGYYVNLDTQNNVLKGQGGQIYKDRFVIGKSSCESGKITSLTPATVQPSTTTIPINAIYNGSQLVYQYNSYNPNQVIVNITNGSSATVTLKKGVYQLYAAGGGGSASQWGDGGYVWVRGGASGGAVEGLFYLSEPKTLTCTAGTLTGGGYSDTPDKTSITIDNSEVVTCVSGKNGYNSSTGGTGGSASFTNALGSVSCVATTGLNSGSLGTYAGSPSVSSKKWGAGGNAPSGEYTYGGIIIQYIRYEV